MDFVQLWHIYLNIIDIEILISLNFTFIFILQQF